jgi:glutathione peroxidase
MTKQLSRRLILGSLAGVTFVSPLALAADSNAYDFTFKAIEGGPLPLSQWRGQPILLVNTASRCGFTYQYDGLQAVYDRYRSEGLIVLGVPSDDFGGQELATEAEVKDFCEVNFSIDFPMTEITRVKGRDAHPFYQWAAESAGSMAVPRWNFHKILIDPLGRIVAGFPSNVKPEGPDVTRLIEEALAGVATSKS